jgi:hypothetical protein
MAKNKRYGRDKQMYIFKSWLLELKTIKAINLITLRNCNPTHGSYEHQHAVIEIKKQFNQKI